MTIEEMQKKRKELGYTYETLSERSGVPLSTVQKVLSGITKNPRYETVQAMEQVLNAAYPAYDSQVRILADEHPDTWPMLLAKSPVTSYTRAEGTSVLRRMHDPDEDLRPLPAPNEVYPLLPHKRQGEYTAEDRDLLPEEVRTELFDGVLYDMAAPSFQHQTIVFEVSLQIHACIDACKKPCALALAPSDVWIAGHNKTIVQPDLYVICDFEDIKTVGHYNSGPLFVMEVLSPSTRSKDLFVKAHYYSTYGVKEYWIVDPKKKQILVYDFTDDENPLDHKIYTFEDTIPLKVSDGHCSVDFKKVTEALARVGLN